MDVTPFPPVFPPPRSEATQCVTLYSRQGTTETIEEVEDEQDHLEDKTQAPSGSQHLEYSQAAEYGPWSDGESRETQEKEQEGPESEEEAEGAPESKETEMAPWESFDPGEGLSVRVEDAESAISAPDREFTTESDEGEDVRGFLQTGRKAGALHTPDTDASKTSDMEVPPSYSKAVSFDRLEVSDDESDTDRRRRMVMTSDSRSDSRSDIVLPSMTTELTASELLLNK